MILHDWFDWSNAGVGMGGLALTVGAIWQATGAKQAAIEAKEAIWQREASDSFSDLERVASQLAVMLQLERPSEAVVLARDLVARIPRDRARFERFLASDSDKLKELEPFFQGLALQLSAPGRLEEKDELQTAVREALAAIGVLSQVHGRLLTRLDEEEQ
jgi:hypothetical protein